jgi:hypothetical protein
LCTEKNANIDHDDAETTNIGDDDDEDTNIDHDDAEKNANIDYNDEEERASVKLKMEHGVHADVWQHHDDDDDDDDDDETVEFDHEDRILYECIIRGECGSVYVYVCMHACMDGCM